MTQTNQKNVPKLRFSEFLTEWQTLKFSDFLNPDFRDVPKPSKQYLALGVRSHGKGIFQKPNSEPEKIAMETLYEVHVNDLVVNITFAWEGAIAIAKPNDHGGLVSHRFPTYTFDRAKVAHEFFEYIIEDKRFRQKLEIISPGGAGRNRVLSKKAFVNIQHRFPTLPEQRKIASFLGAVDMKIAQLSRKKALLEDYKKGCMQQLFSQKIRFKDTDGKDFPDWEEKRLAEVATKTASSISASSLEASPGDYPVYGASGIAGYVDYFTSDDYHIGVVKDGAGVGRLHFCPPNSSILGTLESVKASDGNNLRFIFYWMSLINFGAYSTGSTIPHVYFKDYGKKRGRFPHPDEQRKIADFLSAIDRKIDLVRQEFEQTKTFKKGLLQQMFV